MYALCGDLIFNLLYPCQKFREKVVRSGVETVQRISEWCCLGGYKKLRNKVSGDLKQQQDESPTKTEGARIGEIRQTCGLPWAATLGFPKQQQQQQYIWEQIDPTTDWVDSITTIMRILLKINYPLGTPCSGWDGNTSTRRPNRTLSAFVFINIYLQSAWYAAITNPPWLSSIDLEWKRMHSQCLDTHFHPSYSQISVGLVEQHVSDARTPCLCSLYSKYAMAARRLLSALSDTNPLNHPTRNTYFLYK